MGDLNEWLVVIHLGLQKSHQNTYSLTSMAISTQFKQKFQPTPVAKTVSISYFVHPLCYQPFYHAAQNHSTNTSSLTIEPCSSIGMRNFSSVLVHHTLCLAPNIDSNPSHYLLERVISKPSINTVSNTQFSNASCELMLSGDYTPEDVDDLTALIINHSKSVTDIVSLPHSMTEKEM